MNFKKSTSSTILVEKLNKDLEVQVIGLGQMSNVFGMENYIVVHSRIFGE